MEAQEEHKNPFGLGTSQEAIVELEEQEEKFFIIIKIFHTYMYKRK
jgi:hypothetical protein